MKKLLVAAIALWTGTALGQAQYGRLAKMHFIAPGELSSKPNHPQATQVEYTATITVQGTTSAKQPWTVTVPLNTYAIHAKAPRDSVSGNATGRRQYKPITLTVEQGPAVPLLDHLKKNEPITQVTLSFTPVAPNAPKHTLVVKSIENVQNVTSGQLVQIGFTFEKITWTWVDGGKTTSDDWEAPVV